MLYYVGYTNRIGDVDDGNTVTDFLKAERERGITITSACIPFSWRNHRINLIDTPGHVDFTIEVERSIRVLDGAVCVLDGVAGVEAQTETVWRQANRYQVPRIAYVNKMDRIGASFTKAVKAMQRRLGGWGRPLVVQWPVVRGESHHATGIGSGGPDFEGVVDVLTMEVLDWKKVPKTGSVITRSPLSPSSDPDSARLYQEASAARNALVEKLSEIDDEIVDVFLEHDGDHMSVPADDLRAALRRVTLNGKGVPVLCGASFKNIGVQPVLDAVVDFLPSPADIQPPEAVTSDGKAVTVKLDDKNLCALAFKVTHDPQRGPLVFVRVYSGSLQSRATLFNSSRDVNERANKVLQMYADDFEEIPHIEAGNIACVVGLKETATGDTLLGPKHEGNIHLHPITIPPPVFVRSCEPMSTADDKALENGLRALTREDPSLHFYVDEETGQMLLSGMGELHLEIATERLKEVHKVNCKMGKVLISYRETLGTENVDEDGTITETFLYDKDIFGKKAKAEVTLEISPLADVNEEDGLLPAGRGNEVSVAAISRKSGRASGSDAGVHFPPDIVKAIKSGIEGALFRGPVLGFPLTNLRVECTDATSFGSEVSTPAAFRTAAYRCVQAALQKSGPKLLEPIMDAMIEVPENYIGTVAKDMSGTRRGHIMSLGSEDDDVGEYQHRTVHAHVPLKEMVGYSTAMRGLTAGTGTFTMAIRGYGSMQSDREQSVLKGIRGY
ncbi:Ribosome-releasing factor 2, mitochondrial [Rhizophlyctis rosea]|nr:Ribosome-releasing factor 2, mitochondrial [Rhizophlyctis rosea]